MVRKIIFQVDLGTRLLPCFNSDSGVPYSDVNLATRKAHSPKWSPDSSTSEVTTIQLEFRDLSRCTGDPKFEVSAVCSLILLLMEFGSQQEQEFFSLLTCTVQLWGSPSLVPDEYQG
jgi:hypothetical protein